MLFRISALVGLFLGFVIYMSLFRVIMCWPLAVWRNKYLAGVIGYAYSVGWPHSLTASLLASPLYSRSAVYRRRYAASRSFNVRLYGRLPSEVIPLNNGLFNAIFIWFLRTVETIRTIRYVVLFAWPLHCDHCDHVDVVTSASRLFRCPFRQLSK